MKSKDDAMFWIPLWVDKWIFGSTRIELKHDERAIWVDLLALASKDSGYIRANPDTEYPIQLLAGMLNADTELLERSLQRCIETGKIRKAENGIGYYLINWKEYQLSQRHKRRFERMSAKAATMSAKAASRVYIEKSRVENIKEEIDRSEKKSKRSIHLATDDFILKLKKDPAFEGLDIDYEAKRAKAKLLSPKFKGRKFTEQYFLNWLLRCDRPLVNTTKKDQKKEESAKDQCKWCKEIYFIKDSHECKPENIQLPQ